jgi:hypothetical protein
MDASVWATPPVQTDHVPFLGTDKPADDKPGDRTERFPIS